MTLTPHQIDALRVGIATRREYIAKFRAAPNLRKSDNWDEEEQAINRAETAVDAGSLEELDLFAIIQLRIGYEHALLDELYEKGAAGCWLPIDVHKMLCVLEDDTRTLNEII